MKLSELLKGNEDLIINDRQAEKIQKILKYAVDYPNCEHKWVCIDAMRYHNKGIFESVGIIKFYECSICGRGKKEYI